MAKPNPDWEGASDFTPAQAVPQRVGISVTLTPMMAHIVRSLLVQSTVPTELEREASTLITVLHLAQYGDGNGPDPTS